MSQHIHPSAVVDPGAEIASGVVIGPFTVVEENVEIGAGTRVDSNVRICAGTRLGRDCHVFHGAVVGGIPQDLKFEGEDTVAVIGDRTRIREFVTIHRGTRQRRETGIGSDCLLMAYAHVAHDCLIGDHVVIANAVQLGGHVRVDDWAYIGGMVGVHQFTHIGTHAFVGGGYRCTQDVPPYILVAGEPLKFTGLNVVGLRRRGYSNELIGQLKEAYRLIYRSEFNISQALEQIQSSFEAGAEIDEVISFIRKSERGIVY
jgi:UDP-N-acetylglucosamine acyltransferase